MYLYNLTEEQYEDTVNKGRLVTLAQMVNDGVITNEQYEEYAFNHAIIAKKPSFFNSIWNKIYNKDQKYFIMVQQKSLRDPDDDPDDGAKEDVPDLKVVNFTKE